MKGLFSRSPGEMGDMSGRTAPRLPRRGLRVLALATMMLPGIAASSTRAEPVLWAWERADVLQGLPPRYGVAVVAGFIRLQGGSVAVARGRRFPLVLEARAVPPVGVVHIEIDQRQPLLWTDALRTQVVGAALAFAQPYQAVQIDMEVRDSQRGALLDVLRGVRAGLPPGTPCP